MLGRVRRTFLRSRGGNDLGGNGASCRRLPGLGREPQPRARNAVAQDDELNSGIVLRLLEGFELSADRVWAATSSSARLRPARLHDALGNGRRGAALRRCGMTTTQTLTQTAAAPTLAAPSVVAGEPPWAALPVIIGGALMVILDFFILNVALPSLTTDLHASSAQLEWIVASYALMEAIFLITAGWLSDNLGRRRCTSTASRCSPFPR